MKKILLVLTIILSIVITGCQQNSTSAGQVQNYDITISPGQWIYSSLYERHYYKYYSSIPSDALVVTYVMSASGKQAIPYYSCPTWECIQFDMANSLFEGYLEFEFTNYSSRTTGPNSDQYFYIVAVPHGKIGEYNDVDFTNFEEVVRELELGEPNHLNLNKIGKK
jgi:hypothetical protein